MINNLICYNMLQFFISICWRVPLEGSQYLSSKIVSTGNLFLEDCKCQLTCNALWLFFIKFLVLMSVWMTLVLFPNAETSRAPSNEHIESFWGKEFGKHTRCKRWIPEWQHMWTKTATWSQTIIKHSRWVSLAKLCISTGPFFILNGNASLLCSWWRFGAMRIYAQWVF